MLEADSFALLTIKILLMKKVFLSAITGLLLVCSNAVNAQAWDKSSKVLSIGIGGAYYYHFGNYYRDDIFGTSIRYGYGSLLTGQFTFQGEFGVHDYVGVGFSAGFGGRPAWSVWYAGEVNAPFSALANFHFYQLIQDKTGSNLHADKLDIYGGVSLGSGVAAVFFDNPDEVKVMPIIFGGPHVGIRYYFTPKVAVNGELGYGKTWINAGLSFKL